VPQPKFQLYKHIKISGKWRYCRAAIQWEGQAPRCCGRRTGREARRGLLLHPSQKSWIESQRIRSKLVDQTEYKAVQPAAITKSTSLAQASERYFTNLEARGLDAKSIRTYRTGVDPFVQTCKKVCVEDVTRQDMIDFMGWLRKQPLPKRRNSNPERTYSNKGRLRRNILEGVRRK
jgi:Phage integrase, N-terminal SAM-like domain